jgi:hypothetical protein
VIAIGDGDVDHVHFRAVEQLTVIIEGLWDAVLLSGRRYPIGQIAKGCHANPESAQSLDVNRPNETGADYTCTDLMNVVRGTPRSLDKNAIGSRF